MEAISRHTKKLIEIASLWIFISSFMFSNIKKNRTNCMSLNNIYTIFLYNALAVQKVYFILLFANGYSAKKVSCYAK